MFLHINTFGQQISVHAKDATPAFEGKPAVSEVKDADDNVITPAQDAVAPVPARPAEPVRNAVRQALEYWKRPETDIVALSNGKRLDPNKTPEENGLKENDFIQVVSQEELEESLKVKKEEYEAALKLAGK